MKSQLNNMLSTWRSFYKDASLACALPSRECERDIVRAERCAKTRGLGFFTLDLPAIDGLVTSLLETGSLSQSVPLSGRKSAGDRRPKFLWALWSRVCGADGCLKSDPDPNAILYLRSLSCLHKKYEVACSSNRIEDAVKEYYAIEHQMRLPTLEWDGDTLGEASSLSFSDLDVGVSASAGDQLELFERQDGDLTDEDRRFLARLDRVSAILVTELGYFDAMSEDSVRTGFFRHGPGAVSNLPRNRYKYLFPTWSEKLEGVFPFDWCATGVLGDVPIARSEPSSKLLAVPKTAKGPRLIAAEPIEHQWCQQKILTWLDHAFQHGKVGWFVDLHNQSLSQRMVTQASIDRSLSTIDLSSASDRVSCWHIERLLRSNQPLLTAVHACRTRVLRDGVTSRGHIRLRKFASMGSALTFPLQCLFFLSISLAACGASDTASIRALRKRVRVFGDDIIIPTQAHQRVVRALTILGLKVNSAKSFVHGHFRESCGQDSWRGYDVTPLKPKSLSSRTAEGMSALIQTANNLFVRGHWHAAKAYEELIPHKARKSIYQMEERDDVSGRASPAVPGLASYSGSSYARMKFDRDLHFWYTPQFSAVNQQSKLESRDGRLMLREFFSKPPSLLHARECGVRQKAVAKFATVRVAVKQQERRA